jgi:hypothetical protein
MVMVLGFPVQEDPEDPTKSDEENKVRLPNPSSQRAEQRYDLTLVSPIASVRLILMFA